MATFPLTVLDTFSRTESNGWGTSDSGHVWSGGTDSSWSVSGGFATASIPPTSSKFYDVNVSGSNQESAEVLVYCVFSSATANPYTDFGPVLRYVDDQNFYMVRIRNNFDGVSIVMNREGEWTTLKSASFDLARTQYYWLRFKVSTTNGLQFKIWKSGRKEPSGWTLETPVKSYGPQIGRQGIAIRRTASTYDAQFANYIMHALPDTAVNTMPVTDSFSRDVVNGWGMNANKQPWEGHVAFDSDHYLDGLEGSVTSSDGTANLEITNSSEIERVAMIGPSVSNNIEVLTKFSLSSSSNILYTLGLRGAYQYVDGIMQWTGYGLQIRGGSTQFTLVKQTSFGGGYSTITPSATANYTALASNTQYWVRFQISGTTLQARLWADGAGEPGTWNLTATDSSITSGRLWVSGSQNGAATRSIKIFDITMSRLLSGTTPLTTGALTTTAITDTTLALRAAFTNDSDSDSSITVDYRKVGDTYWTSSAATKTRVGSPLSWTTTITNLEPNTQYEVRVTFIDPDGVAGTNPVINTFTTNDNSLIPGEPFVTNTTTSSVDITAPYTADADDDSTATVDYRVSSQITYRVKDTFTGAPQTPLQDHSADIGGDWVKHPSYSGDDAKLWTNSLYGDATENVSDIFFSGDFGDYVVYYNAASLGKDQTITANIRIPRYSEFESQLEEGMFSTGPIPRSVVGLIGRASSATNTMYVAIMRYALGDFYWEIYEINSGTVANSGLPMESTHYTPSPVMEEDHVYEIVFTLTDEWKILTVDGVEIFRSASNNIAPASSYAGVLFGRQTIEDMTPDNSIIFTSFDATYRTNNPSWTSAGAMTADRGESEFTKTVGSLSSDTTYEFRIIYADADGLRTQGEKSLVATTAGQTAQLSALAGVPRSTSVVLTTTYLYDTNSNSSLTVQYRPLHDIFWTTISSKRISVNRTTKTFSTLLVNLRPNTSYEVLVTLSDADGVLGDTTLKTLVTTKGVIDSTTKETKHYTWKIYDYENNYITTWADAEEPEFSWHENGGVTDLSVTLPRTLASLNEFDSGINHQNRVDIWCLDPSSTGFGPNMAVDPLFTQGAWTLGSNATIDEHGGPDDTSALKIVSATSTQVNTRSGAIYLHKEPTTTGSVAFPTTLTFQTIARALGSKLTMLVEAYDIKDVKLDTSDTVDTVGSDWQTLFLEWTPPAKTHYIRVMFRNDHIGTMWASYVSVLAKELLIYRGRIESYTPRIEEDGEDISVQVLGLVSLLTDDYVEFLQYVTTQQQKDVDAGRANKGPADPGDMMRDVIDIARKQNPHCILYYTTDSIRNTGRPMEYTFRDQQLRTAFDKIRNLCPPGWHYYIEADGLVILRGPEHAPTYTLRIGAEILNFSVERSIRNVKNYIEVKGRQDEDESEPDGFGSIKYITFDQASIDRYGKRMLFIRDANITDPDTAELIGDGRLAEYNREEQRGQCYIPDNKSLFFVSGSLRGDNIEKFRPGDNIIILDPAGEIRLTRWNEFVWSQDAWDATPADNPLPESVPIKTVQFGGTFATLELSERQPSGVIEYGRFYRYLQLQDNDSA